MKQRLFFSALFFGITVLCNAAPLCMEPLRSCTRTINDFFVANKQDERRKKQLKQAHLLVVNECNDCIHTIISQLDVFHAQRSYWIAQRDRGLLYYCFHRYPFAWFRTHKKSESPRYNIRCLDAKITRLYAAIGSIARHLSTDITQTLSDFESTAAWIDGLKNRIEHAGYTKKTMCCYEKPTHAQRWWAMYVTVALLGYASYKNYQIPNGLLQRFVSWADTAVRQDIPAILYEYGAQRFDGLLTAFGYAPFFTPELPSDNSSLLQPLHNRIDTLLQRFCSQEGKQALQDTIQQSVNEFVAQYRPVSTPEVPRNQSFAQRLKSGVVHVGLHNPVTDLVRNSSVAVRDYALANGSNLATEYTLQTIEASLAPAVTNSLATGGEYLLQDLLKETVLPFIEQVHQEYQHDYRVQLAFLRLLPPVIVTAIVGCLIKTGYAAHGVYKEFKKVDYQPLHTVLRDLQEFLLKTKISTQPDSNRMYGELLYRLQRARAVGTNVCAHTKTEFDAYLGWIADLERLDVSLQDKQAIIELILSLYV